MKIENKLLFCEEKLGIKLDSWQKEILEEEKNIAIRAGRQVGKSLAVSMKASFYALENDNKTVLIVAASQRQASLLFEKVKSFFVEHFPDTILEEPTITRLRLKNKTTIYSLPAGRTGYAIRGFSIDLLIADEAAFISESVWLALIPMLAVTRGKIILLSTPWGKGGFFWKCFGDNDFRQFHIKSTDCKRIPESFIEKQRSELSKLEFAQEYLGEFIEEYTQFFPTILIRERCNIEEWSKENYKRENTYFLGVDVARYGGDENAFVVSELDNDKNIKIVHIETTSRISTTDTIGRVLKLDEEFKFRNIYVDDAGIGGGVTDVLIEKLGRKIKGINNSKKSIDKEGLRKIKILKEDLYSNVLVLMEQGRLKIIDTPEVKRSLASVQFEYTAEKRLKIYGKYTHITEALVRSCWCIKDKSLNIYIY